jgi:DNA-binding MarR family transcriptional regulator
MIESRPGAEDRRQRLLRLTEKGATLEAELFEVIKERLGTAYAQAGQDAVTGFWRVLEQLIPIAERAHVAELDRNSTGR